MNRSRPPSPTLATAEKDPSRPPGRPTEGDRNVTTRSYRVHVSDQFAGLTPAVSAQLRGEQAEHDLFLSAFTPAGTFTYTPTLTR
jgi:hypothetical protein